MGAMQEENGFDRLDRKLGTIWGRFWGTVLLLPALYMIWRILTADDFSIGGYWPMIVGVSVLGLCARACFRSREGLLRTIGDVPDQSITAYRKSRQKAD